MTERGHQMTNDSSADAIIIGAGFAGISALYHLRKIGLTCRIVERGHDIGGVWHWNRYPGARTDSGIPSYMLNIPECWQTWSWSELFPDHNEINGFLDHCDKQIDIRKHVTFGKSVTGARFNSVSGSWAVELDDETIMTSKYLVCAVGTACQRSDLMDEMIKDFRGQVYFPCSWPRDNVNPEGQDVAIIGTGSTALQIIQEWGPRAKSLTVYQRSYNAALPLPSRPYEGLDHRSPKEILPGLFDSRKRTPSGLAIVAPQKKGTFEVPDGEREEKFEELFTKGLAYWVGGYKDLTSNQEANRASYDFWARKTRQRIHDPRKRDILAPLTPMYPFGAKRPALERGYFELFNRENIDVVDTCANPIASAANDRIVLKDGTANHHDIIIPAVGYTLVKDIYKSLGLRDTENMPLDELWSGGTRTFLGVMHQGFPNMFMLCGPQSPGEQCNVPACIDLQATWMADTIRKMEREQIISIRPKSKTMEEWNEKVYKAYNKEFYSSARCRYTSAGEPLFYGGGIARYSQELVDATETWEHFDVVKGASMDSSSLAVSMSKSLMGLLAANQRIV